MDRRPLVGPELRPVVDNCPVVELTAKMRPDGLSNNRDRPSQ